jgi:5-methylcytosine-specific restriction endonuclease McrA
MFEITDTKNFSPGDLVLPQFVTSDTDSNRSLENCPALILNADYRPLSYFPLSIWPWQEAVKAIFRDSVTVISEYDRHIHSPSFEFRLPSVLALKEYIRPSDKPAFTRFNVFLRDVWHCQYCGDPFKTHQLTFDHVIPRSKGGTTCWTNIVAACRPCNTRKGHRLPKECDMHPMTAPRAPSLYELQETGRKFPPNYLHESWSDFLYWDSTLEE